MYQLIAIAIGGALGSVLRFLASKGVHNLFGYDFPFGILTVNILGSFFMGLLVVLFIDRLNIEPIWSAAILIGFLGGFTTFASFSIDTINLLINGAPFLALLYMLASVICCLLAAWSGVLLGWYM